MYVPYETLALLSITIGPEYPENFRKQSGGRKLLLLICVIFTAGLHAVEHFPQLEGCRAKLMPAVQCRLICSKRTVPPVKDAHPMSPSDFAHCKDASGCFTLAT